MLAPRECLIVIFEKGYRYSDDYTDIRQNPVIFHYHRKILSGADAPRTQRLRAAGKRLVFTTGVFDLYCRTRAHLAQARAEQTLWQLATGIKPYELKSGSADLQHLTRGDIAALRFVDYVTIFDNISPRNLITQLLPDVLVKGDYQLDRKHGREEVEAAGGKVISLPFVEGASTTDVIRKMSHR